MFFNRLLACFSILILSFGTAAESQTQTEVDYVAGLTKHQQTSASALVFIAAVAFSKGDYRKALDGYKKLRDIYKDDPGLGTDSGHYAWALSKIALCRFKLDQNEDAAKLCKEALAIIAGRNEDNSPEDGNYLILTKENCASVLGKDMPADSVPKLPEPVLRSLPLCEIADLSSQEKLARETLKIAEKHDASGLQTQKRRLYLANILTLEKKTNEAEPLFRKAIASVEKKFGKNSLPLLPLLSNYGYMLKESGREKEAELTLKRMQQIASCSGLRS